VSPPRNPEALAENLQRLLADEDLLKRIAENGYQHIRQFTWERAVARMESLFCNEVPKGETLVSFPQSPRSCPLTP
jgi:glycosyltransferase involved in cell wall biosynthesis